MPRRQFEQVVASAPRQELVVLNADSSEQVAIDGEEQIDIYVPTGKVGVVQALYLNVLPIDNATAGTHLLVLSSSLNSSGYSLAESNFDSSIQWGKMAWTYADVRTEPTNEAAVVLGVKGALFDSQVGFRINYLNKTDVAIPQGVNRTYRLNYKMIDAAGVV